MYAIQINAKTQVTALKIKALAQKEATVEKAKISANRNLFGTQYFEVWVEGSSESKLDALGEAVRAKGLSDDTSRVMAW